jgi:hypothetical protein
VPTAGQSGGQTGQEHVTMVLWFSTPLLNLLDEMDSENMTRLLQPIWQDLLGKSAMPCSQRLETSTTKVHSTSCSALHAAV